MLCGIVKVLRVRSKSDENELNHRAFGLRTGQLRGFQSDACKRRGRFWCSEGRETGTTRECEGRNCEEILVPNLKFLQSTTTTTTTTHTWASLGRILNSMSSMDGTRKWIKLHSNTPSRSVRARILISELLQLALCVVICDKKGKIIFLLESSGAKMFNCVKPVIRWNLLATSQPSSALTPKVVW